MSKRPSLAGRLLTAVVWTCLFIGFVKPAASDGAGAGLALSNDVGPPTSHTTTIGAGFGSLEQISISFDGQRIATASTESGGAFVKSVAIPRQAQPGIHIVSAAGRDSGLTASASFTVQTDWPTFHFTPERTGNNPYENTLSKSSVSGLAPIWIAALPALTAISPAVVGGVVYEGDYASNLFAFDAATGSQIWAADLGNLGITDPAYANGVLYVGTTIDSTVVAIDAVSGTPIWETSVGGAAYGAPVVSAGVVYIGSNDGKLYALDANTGAKIWAVPYSGAPGDPTVANGTVFVGGYDQRLHAFDAVTGIERWSVLLEDILYSTPAVVGDVVYLGSGNMPPYHVYAIDAATGTILWTTDVSGQVNSSPAVAKGTVYVNTFDGYLWAMKTSTGELRWSKAVGGCNSSPAVANGVVYVGSDDFSAYAVNATTGATLWSWGTGDKVCSSPVIADGVLYVGSFDAKFYAFGLP